MPSSFDELAVRNADGTVPAVSVVNVPATAKGLPAVNILQGDSTGPAVTVRGGGTLLDLQDTTAASKFKVDSAGNLTVGGTDAQQPFTLADCGFLAWNYDYGLSSSGSTPTTNVVNVARINIRAALSVTNVVVAVTTAGSGLTSGQNFIGLYNSAGTLIGTSADQTTPWGTTGVKAAALVSGPFTVSAGFVWVAFVSNTGTSTPSLLRTGALGATSMNAGFTASTARWATNGTATTSLPSTITPASNTLAGIGYWVALS